ncbi:LysR family transcriptional regulator [Azospirillum halopraeferens]|uniref:LysR family transcriptional regulator n=1 Tax=Azospirillum halopraeferens TaxID=34010 RepID=UPI000683ECFA|nr:LysR family transcriptional regulator [Azospirillum halopraeferens]
MSLARVDLNLLLVFDAVMIERNVTRAAQRLGMTQPAVSNALGRLRLTVKDDLFVRATDGMRPTPRASDLSVPIRECLQHLEICLDQAGFDPLTTNRTFRIGMSEYSSALMLERISLRLRAEAPKARLHTMPLTHLNLTEWLDSGDIDLAISPRVLSGDVYRMQPLFGDNFMVAMRRDHPLAARPLDLDGYCGAEHILISMSGNTSSPVEEVVRATGRSRNIVLTVNHFLLALKMAGDTDMLLTAPGKLIGHYQGEYGLHVAPSPIDVPFGETRMTWHVRLGSHPALDWFRAMVAEECSVLVGSL